MIDEYGVEVVSSPTTVDHLKQTALWTFGDLGLVKAVVDIERRVMAIGGGLHVDEQAALLNAGSRQAALRGINRYPELFGAEEWLEYDSTMNLRPPGNRSREVLDPGTRAEIAAVVGELVAP